MLLNFCCVAHFNGLFIADQCGNAQVSDTTGDTMKHCS